MKPVATSLPSIKRSQTQNAGESQAHGSSHTIDTASSIGEILVDTGRLSAENAERILRTQIDQGKRFGDTAIELGLLTEEDIRFALSRQFDNFYLPSSDTSLDHKLVAAYKPFSPTVEKLRALRGELMMRWFNSETQHNALAVMSPGAGEGRSFIAANLAILFSQLGERTLLLDADLRTPCQGQLFKLGNNAGLSGMLAGRIGPEAVTRVPRLPGLYVLPAGAVPPNPHELLGRPAFAALLQSLIRDFDIVIVDTPAAGQNAESQVIAVGVSSVLMLARKNRSLVPEMIKLTHRLQQNGAKLAGSVLNDF
jgi:chain length determinant protein tyrosine kinase EpsG